MLAAGTMPVLLYLLSYPMPVVLLSIVFAILIIIKHSSNIQRLLSGTENKIGSKKK